MVPIGVALRGAASWVSSSIRKVSEEQRWVDDRVYGSMEPYVVTAPSGKEAQR
jgi:hypothetical protein